MSIELERPAMVEMSKRSRLTPRIANRLLKRVRDWAEVHGKNKITNQALDETLKILDIDDKGLEASDRRIIEAIISKYKGGPVGVNAIAAATGEERLTIEDVYEPYLIQIGMLERTNRGRRVTEQGYNHLGFDLPDNSDQSQLF